MIRPPKEWIEGKYQSRHFGTYKEAGAGYDYNNLKGQPKNGDGNGPKNRRKWNWLMDSAKGWLKFKKRLDDLKKERFCTVLSQKALQGIVPTLSNQEIQGPAAAYRCP